MLATHENGAVAACAVDAGRSEREPEVRARLRGGRARSGGGLRGASNKTYLL